MVEMGIKVLDVCVEFFKVPSYVFQVGVYVLQFSFHVVYELFCCCQSVHHFLVLVLQGEDSLRCKIVEYGCNEPPPKDLRSR
jgi:hypothetical protein